MGSTSSFWITRFSGRAPSRPGRSRAQPGQCNAPASSAITIRRSPSSFSTCCELDADDVVHRRTAQPFEEDDLVDPVEEFRAEMSADAGHHRRAGGLHVIVVIETREGVGAHVGRHDDQGVAEVDRPALAVSQPAVIQHLQEDVEDVGVGLLDLIEQQHLDRAGAARFRSARRPRRSRRSPEGRRSSG